MKPVDLTESMAQYAVLGKEITALEKQRGVHKEAILQHMREQGEVEAIEAGGFRASISFRRYYGFSDTDERGEPLTDTIIWQRLAALRKFFAEHAPMLDVPASDKIGKAVECWVQTLPEGQRDEPPLPPFLKESKTPSLRVSGSGAS